MSSNGSDRSLERAIDRLVHSGRSDPLFMKAILLSRERGYNHIQALQLLASVVLPPQPENWQVLGCPTKEKCGSMAATLEAVAEVLTSGASEDIEVRPLPCGRLPDILAYAAVQTSLPVAFADLVEILGPIETAQRVRKFARELRSVHLIG